MEGEIILAFLIHRTLSTMVSRRIFYKCANYVDRFVSKSGLRIFKVENVPLHQFILKSPRWRVEIFWVFLILGTMSTMVSRRIFDKRANYVERFVKILDIANFQGGKCTFALIYLKISAMEGEIFWAFLILGTMSTMVSRRIFDKRAN